MADFASAAMLRLLAAGMHMHGLAAPPLPAADGALVRLDDKRALLSSALEQAGPAILPRLGRGVHALRSSPLYAALLGGAPSPLTVLRRWCRLERYVHSRHRCAIAASGANWVGVRHHALAGLPAPQPAEDLVLLGVQAALLELAGCARLAVRVEGTPVWPNPEPGALAQLIAMQGTALWRVEWDDTATPGAGASDWPASQADPHWPALARRVFELLSQDLMDAPPIGALARRLDTAPRSLQRRLGQAGLSYRFLLAEARLRHASAALLDGRASMAEIGLVCGFADQAHFIREFGRRTGMSPGAYQACFRRAP